MGMHTYESMFPAILNDRSEVSEGTESTPNLLNLFVASKKTWSLES